ncbi:MAG: ABC transporter permease [Candidatus Krumholzibacteria bacterium]|nr:ABC transporter permease [Candidatus Krumholzibacteria bacterium]
MSSLWHVALHDLRQHLSERSNIFFLFLMPLGFVFFFALVNAGGRDAQVLVGLPVVDRDGDFLASAFAAQLRGENFDATVYTAAAAETTVLRTRFVTIPDSFTLRVLHGRRTQIDLTARARSDEFYDLAAGVRLHQAQVRFLSNLWRWSSAEGGPRIGPELDTATVDSAMQGRFPDLVAEPSRVAVEAGFAGRGRPVPRGTQQSVPGVLVMFVVMTVLIGGCEALTRERQQGTLRRLATTPLSMRQVLLGKTLGLILLGVAQAAILVVITDLMSRLGLLGLDFLWAPYLLGAGAVIVAYCACIAALGLLISGFLRTPQQAESLVWLFGMVLSALGGAWWPLEIMPAGMRLVGQFFPTTWAMQGLHNVITYGQGLAGAIAPVVVLLAMGVVFWAVGSRTLRVTN